MQPMDGRTSSSPVYHSKHASLAYNNSPGLGGGGFDSRLDGFVDIFGEKREPSAFR